MPFHGHTPGHTGYMIASGNEQLLVWGDMVRAVPEVQTARPEACMAFDTSTEQASHAPPRLCFDMVPTDKLMVTGMHFPGFSRLVKAGTGYRLIPAAWEQAL